MTQTNDVRNSYTFLLKLAAMANIMTYTFIPFTWDSPSAERPFFDSFLNLLLDFTLFRARLRRSIVAFNIHQGLMLPDVKLEPQYVALPAPRILSPAKSACLPDSTILPEISIPEDQ